LRKKFKSHGHIRYRLAMLVGGLIEFRIEFRVTVREATNNGNQSLLHAWRAWIIE